MFSTRTIATLGALLAVILVSTTSVLAEKEPRQHQPPGLAVGRNVGSANAEHDDRGKQPSKRRVNAIHGEIAAISGNIWTVSTENRGDVHVDVSGAKVMWPSRPNATLAEFIVGDHVNIRMGRTASTSATTTTGVVFKAQSVHFVPGRSLARFSGDVTTISTTSITVIDKEGGSKTFTINSATTIRESADLVSAAQIKVGSQVMVVTRKHADLALIIVLRGPALDKFKGDVTAISATSITVMDKEGGSKTFTIDANTAIREGGKTITTTDIKVGDHATVGTQQNSTLAVTVEVRPALSLFRGQVTAVSSTSLTVMDREGGSATFTVNSSTSVKLEGATAAITDVKVGERVVVTTHKGDNTALSILIVDDEPVSNVSGLAAKLRALARERDRD